MVTPLEGIEERPVPSVDAVLHGDIADHQDETEDRQAPRLHCGRSVPEAAGEFPVSSDGAPRAWPFVFGKRRLCHANPWGARDPLAGTRHLGQLGIGVHQRLLGIVETFLGFAHRIDRLFGRQGQCGEVFLQPLQFVFREVL